MRDQLDLHVVYRFCDVKYKRRPKAVERIFWTHGVAVALAADSACVVTTDKRQYLRSIARRLNVHLIDGSDVNRIKTSSNVVFSERLHDEELKAEFRAVDFELRSQSLQNERHYLLSSLTEGFGTKSIVSALGSFTRLAKLTVASHPDSRAARASARLAYLAAAVACASLDYLSNEVAFGTAQQKRELIVDSIRMGILNDEIGQLALKLAVEMIERFAPGGVTLASGMKSKLTEELSEIPAEVIADQAVRLAMSDELFETGRELEMSCYALELPTFDILNRCCKSMIGSLLDYGGIARSEFAQAWKPPTTQCSVDSNQSREDKRTPTQQSLFDDAD